MPSLFDPIQLGALALPSRVIMAPLTRGRATRDHVPTPIMAEYYAPARQRRADHQRGDRHQPARHWLAIRPRYLERRAGRRLAPDHPGGA